MIDKQQALTLLEEVVAERPDYVYLDDHNACVYQEGGKPSCLVGQVCFRAGVNVEILKGWDTYDEDSGSIDTDLGTVDTTKVMTEEARNLLWEAQKMQDCGRSWQQALDAARQV